MGQRLRLQIASLSGAFAGIPAEFSQGDYGRGGSWSPRKRSGNTGKGTRITAPSVSPTTTLSPRPYQRTIAEAQVKPEPKLANRMCWPFCTMPFFTASSSAMGMEAAVVFPYSWILL